MEEKNIFQQKLDLFLQEYLAETIHTIRQQNPICKELVKAKASQEYSEDRLAHIWNDFYHEQYKLGKELGQIH